MSLGEIISPYKCGAARRKHPPTYLCPDRSAQPTDNTTLEALSVVRGALPVLHRASSPTATLTEAVTA
jgi:hypothetical protein